MSKKKDIHVVPHPEGGWGTRAEGAARFGRKTETQREAIDIGRNQARREQSELVIHGRNGQIRDSDSYGNDPHPPKDKKH